MKKILVVEDEVAYSKILYDQLTERGYQVVQASDGEKGISVSREEKPDLILLDIRMPKMDGIAMLKLLRKDPMVKNTKVIMLTNLEPDDRIIAEVVNNEPSHYFVKSDIRYGDLLDKIKELLGE